MNPAAAQAIASHTRRARIACATRGGILLLLAATLPLAAAAWLDAHQVFTPAVRWLAFAAATAAILLALAAALRGFRRIHASAITAAMDASSALADGYVISTSNELATATREDPTAQAMLTRLHHEAGKLATASTPRPPWPGKPLLAATAAALLLAAALIATHGTQPALRICLPWAPLPYTTITLTGPEILPAENEPFALHGALHGRLAPEATLTLGNGQRIPVPVAADGTFTVAFPEGIAEATTATATAAADGISPTIPLDLRIIPVELPTFPNLVAYRHTLTPPAYTGQPQREETRPSFTLLRASEVEFTATFDRPATAARITFDNAREPLDLTPTDADPLTWQANLGPIPRTFGYTLEVSDANGTYPVEPLPQQIVATPDHPPTISITQSNTKDLGTRSDTLTLSYTAGDDIGLANIGVIAFRLGDDQPTPAILATFDTPTLTTDGTWQLPLADLNARPLDEIVVILQATDTNKLDGPGIGYSEPLIIEIPEPSGDDAEDGPPPPKGPPPPPADITLINPLELQRQIYRDTLRASLGRSSRPIPELADSQKEIPGYINVIANYDIPLGPEFTNLLRTASEAAQQAALALDRMGPDPLRPQRLPADLPAALRHQATAINALVKAARMQLELMEDETFTANLPSDQVVVSLFVPSIQSQDKTDEEAQERIAEALNELQQALEQQEQLNKEMQEGGSKSPADSSDPSEPTDQKGKPTEGEPTEGRQSFGQQGEGQPTEGQSGIPGPGGKGGEPTDSAPAKAEPTDSPPTDSSPQTLAQRQLALADLSQEILQQLETLQATPTGADPALAAAQMRRASEYQRQAAEAILKNNTADASAAGNQSASAIRSAIIITESLLDRAVQPGIEATARPTGYQGLIQDYSRRLSYDQ